MPSGGRPAGDLALGPGDALDAAETLQMGAPGVGDERHLGTGDGGQIGDLARMIGPHLQDQEVLVPGSEQGEGHSDVVVQVALGGADRSNLVKDGGDHLLDGGLAVAAGDGHHPPGEAVAPGGGQAAEAQAGVVYQPLGQFRIQGTVHQGGGGALGRGLGDKVMAVEARPPQGHEEGPAAVLTGVGDHAMERRVRAQQSVPPAAAQASGQGPHQ